MDTSCKGGFFTQGDKIISNGNEDLVEADTSLTHEAGRDRVFGDVYQLSQAVCQEK
jgi:hypothetical protein